MGPACHIAQGYAIGGCSALYWGTKASVFTLLLRLKSFTLYRWGCGRGHAVSVVCRRGSAAHAFSTKIRIPRGNQDNTPASQQLTGVAQASSHWKATSLNYWSSDVSPLLSSLLVSCEDTIAPYGTLH